METEQLVVLHLPNGPWPVEVCQSLLDQSYPFLLDSAMAMPRYGRYSYTGADPFLVLKSKGEHIEIIDDAGTTKQQGDPLMVLQQLLQRYRLPRLEAPLPFQGGAVGYLGYDLCHFIEQLPCTTIDDIAIPDLYMAFYDVIYGYDNETDAAYIISTGLPEPPGPARRARARQRVEQLQERLAKSTIYTEAASSAPRLPAETASAAQVRLQSGRGRPSYGSKMTSGEPQSNFTHTEYLKAVKAAKEYIAAGDIFQVNLSQRFQAPLTADPWQLYRRLRQINPAPFAAYLDFGEGQMVSASPEKFMEVQAGHVQTRPVKGTRPRGRTPEEDERLAQELISSEKDNAELVMIVDLERNDLGRVCKFGTIRTPQVAALETFPTVHHLVGTVIGQLEDDKDNVDLLRAVFPGGSITGAPKIRSMEIIDELEPTQRSVYTGNIGYLGFDGNMQLSIVIRTFVITNGMAYYQVGGGIVADSDPEAEYQETLAKGRALRQALCE